MLMKFTKLGFTETLVPTSITFAVFTTTSRMDHCIITFNVPENINQFYGLALSPFLWYIFSAFDFQKQKAETT